VAELFLLNATCLLSEMMCSCKCFTHVCTADITYDSHITAWSALLEQVIIWKFSHQLLAPQKTHNNVRLSPITNYNRATLFKLYCFKFGLTDLFKSRAYVCIGGFIFFFLVRIFSLVVSLLDYSETLSFIALFLVCKVC
jgi:hypothetical protein